MKHVLLLLAILPAWIHAGESVGRSLMLKPVSEELVLTGNLTLDLLRPDALAGLEPLQDEGGTQSAAKKSPWLAAGLSALVPGAGEFYAESYWKAAAFLAVDIVAWALVYSLNKKGDNQTESFQKYADEHWSAVRYAEYPLSNRSNLLPDTRKRYYDSLGLVNPNTSLAPWQRVNWNLLNRMEREIGASAGGTYYSHTLPVRPDQQYYELIGKYHQYNQGWDDAPPSFVYGDPVTDRFTYYSAERGKANDYYADATTFVTVAVANHVLSAIDAAWSASSFNKRIHASMHIRTIPTRDRLARIPVAHVEYRF